MKNFLNLKYFSILFSGLFACGQSAVANGANTIVRGTVHNPGTQSVALYKVENGEPVKIAFRWPAKDGSFSFEIALEKEAIFFITKGVSKTPDFKNVLYLKPEGISQLDLYSSNLALEFDSCKVNNRNQETELLQQWTNLFTPVCKAGRSPNQRELFLNAYSALVPKAESFKNLIHTSNNYFNRLLKLKVDVDLEFARAAAFFYFNERLNSTYDTSMSHRPFYKPVLQENKYCSTLLLNTDHGMGLLKYYMAVHRFLASKSISEFQRQSYMTAAVDLICNDTLKGVVVMSYLPRILTQEELSKNIQPYEKYFLTAALKEEYEKKKTELMPFGKGSDAYNFSLPDIHDKNVSLKDFKGKVVVLDMWAMWCAPCLQEKPYFKKIEEEYKGNDQIVFISVSTDGMVKRDPWKNFIKRKGWDGIELISEYTESLMKYYKVEGIPRFMIFDKNGKIVTVNAPRPSDPGFKSLIEQTLQNKI